MFSMHIDEEKLRATREELRVINRAQVAGKSHGVNVSMFDLMDWRTLNRKNYPFSPTYDEPVRRSPRKKGKTSSSHTQIN